MPWKVLGQKWHLSQKGFPPGKKTAWKPEVLEELLEMLADAVPGGQFLWNNQNVVYLMVPGVRKPWATVFTKRLAGVDLVLNGPKGAFQLGSVAELGAERRSVDRRRGPRPGEAAVRDDRGTARGKRGGVLEGALGIAAHGGRRLTPVSTNRQP